MISAVNYSIFTAYSLRKPFSTRLARILGISQIELLITLLIVSLLSAFALPDLSRFWQRQQSDVYIQTLQRAIAMTRSTAITSREITSLCPYGGSSCGDRWEDGLMIFIDKNNNGIIDNSDDVSAENHETLAEVIDFVPNNSTINWRASGGKNYLRYSPTGIARQFGRFHLCDKNGNMSLARSLVVNRQGKTRVYRDRDGDNIVEDVNGDTPDCGG